MIPPILTAVIVFAWVVFAIIAGIYDMATVNTGPFNTLMQFEIFREAEVSLIITSFKFPIPNFDYFTAIGALLVWNYSLFSGMWNYVRVLFLIPLSVAMILALLITIFSAVLSRR